MILTYKYRIKDSTSKANLKRFASSVNFVWNYINDLSYRSIKQYGRFLSAYDINGYTVCSSKEFNLHASTIQEISSTYANNRFSSKRNKLKWRSSKKKTLGWIPVKAYGLKFISDDSVRYQKTIFRIYKSRPIPVGAKIKIASFIQDNRDRWYLSIVIDVPEEQHTLLNNEIGIDFGLKNKLTLSDGTIYTRPSLTKLYADRLALAQRANKKKQVKSISAKIANSRNDWNHKTTTEIAKTYGNIYVGDLKAEEITSEHNSERNKNIYDSSPYQLKLFLKYKVSRLGGTMKLINEAYTTQQCNCCGNIGGPKGEKELHIREWICSKCRSVNDRDVNAAKNILRIGHYTLLRESSSNLEEDVKLQWLA